MNHEAINSLVEKGILSDLDVYFADFMTGLAGGDNPELFLAAALVSNFRGKGHVCLEIPSVAGRSLPDENGQETVVCPEADVWQKKIMRTPVVGRPGERCPLILDDRSRLYLYRYWQYQETLARLLNNRIRGGRPDIDREILKQGLTRLFPAVASGEPDWQKVAACAALFHRFCVISGGPGTGKTTTIAKIIALILQQEKAGEVRIALAAPTGKAASRLQASMKNAKKSLDCPDDIREAIPVEAATIHRLLGTIPDSPYFFHNPGRPLRVDVMIVDEASMVDMALMSKLVQALPAEARLILLGDRDQLSSVEAGAVLGDICDSGHAHGFSAGFLEDLYTVTGLKLEPGGQEGDSSAPVRDCVIQLQRSYRFGDDSGIGAVSRAVNAGDSEKAVSLMKHSSGRDITWRRLPRREHLARDLRQIILREFDEYPGTEDPREVLQKLERFRILCAVREGPCGVSALNLMVERILRDAGKVDSGKTWYAGRPVLITRNDYTLGVFNGDVGVVLEDPEVGHDLRVFFHGAGDSLKSLHPLRLPEHETVFAMTVHKSQGSEFDRVLMILPDRDYPVLTRELIYTGVTRARKHVEIWAVEDVFQSAVARRTQRASGLRDALWEA